MTKMTFLAAAAVLTSLIASPVMAQSSSQPMSTQHRQTSDRQMDNDRQDSGFWPGDVAAGVVGGAVGTAGAIATAPFRDNDYAYNDAYNDSYAYDNDDCMTDGQKAAGGCGLNHHENYAARNGFVCQPGTWIRMEDGQRHLCQ